jgi:hypothetical protein
MVLSLVRVEVTGEFRIGAGYLPDAHQPAHRPVVADSGPDLLRGQVTPPVPLDPPDRDDDERREDVDEVVIADAVRAVDPVHPPDGRPPPRRCRPVSGYFPQERDGVVVALLAPGRELAGLIEDLADRRHGEGVEDRQLVTPVRFPAEGLAERMVESVQVVLGLGGRLGERRASGHGSPR